MTIPASAPQYSDLYSQSNLVEAKPVSTHRLYEGDQAADKPEVPAMVTIPSSNVMLAESPAYQQRIDYTTAPVDTNPVPEPPHQRLFRGRPVKDKNAHLPDAVLTFKQDRKVRTAASTWAGGVIGLFTFGPIGAAVGAGAAYSIAKGVGKHREKKLVERTGTLPARIATSATPQADGYGSEEVPVYAASRPLPAVV